MQDLRPYGIPDEPVVYDSFSAGADLVCFSGDKLLGGPQAGIIAGARKLVDPIRRNPLMRTYRVDKLRYGALEATLGSYRLGRAALEIPIVRMMSVTAEDLKKRTARFRRRLAPRLPDCVRTALSGGFSVIGGGSCPDCHLPATLLAIESESPSPNTIESRLRLGEQPIIVRLEEDRVMVDLRTVFPEQEPLLIEGIIKAVACGQ
jgi:L-seryl-tRNA(Ser) seleniumtransferase